MPNTYPMLFTVFFTVYLHFAYTGSTASVYFRNTGQHFCYTYELCHQANHLHQTMPWTNTEEGHQDSALARNQEDMHAKGPWAGGA